MTILAQGRAARPYPVLNSTGQSRPKLRPPGRYLGFLGFPRHPHLGAFSSGLPILVSADRLYHPIHTTILFTLTLIADSSLDTTIIASQLRHLNCSQTFVAGEDKMQKADTMIEGGGVKGIGFVCAFQAFEEADVCPSR